MVGFGIIILKHTIRWVGGGGRDSTDRSGLQRYSAFRAGRPNVTPIVRQRDVYRHAVGEWRVVRLGDQDKHSWLVRLDSASNCYTSLKLQKYGNLFSLH